MHLAREVRRLAVPAIMSSLLQTLVFVVDRIMLGHYSDASLAAMQVAGPLEWSVWSIFSAFVVGTIARVGRHVGAHDPARARAALLSSLALAVVCGALLLAASPLVTAALPRAASRASPASIAEAQAYLGVTLAASPVVFVAMAAVAALQAGGDTRTPLAIGVLVNVVHVATNRVLILGAFGVPASGAHGAAVSSALTFALEALLALAFLSRPGAVSLRRPPGDPVHGAALVAEARELVGVGTPALFERIVYHAGFLGYVAVITRLGDRAMAANQSLISVEAVCFLSADGFGIAAAALVAQKLGAREPALAARAARISAGYAVILLTTFGLVFLATRGAVLPLFSRDPAVLSLGSSTVPVLACAQPFMAIGIVIAQSLRGAGHTRPVFVVSGVSALVVRVSCTWFFAITLGLGLVGVWMGSTVDWMVRSALLVAIGRRRARAAQESLL